MLLARRVNQTTTNQRVTAAAAAAQTAAAAAAAKSSPQELRPQAAAVPLRASQELLRLRLRLTKHVRLVCVVCSVLFVLTTCANLTLTVYALNVRLTRIAQINLGYQIVFLMPFIPFLFGILFENRELLVPFFVINVYSTVFNVIITILVNLQVVDHAPLNAIKISVLCISSAIVSTVCAIFICLLFNRYTKLLEFKQSKEDSDFKINAYSMQRYGEIMSSSN